MARVRVVAASFASIGSRRSADAASFRDNDYNANLLVPGIEILGPPAVRNSADPGWSSASHCDALKSVVLFRAWVRIAVASLGSRPAANAASHYDKCHNKKGSFVLLMAWVRVVAAGAHVAAAFLGSRWVANATNPCDSFRNA
jgi:hypothetical protein